MRLGRIIGFAMILNFGIHSRPAAARGAMTSPCTKHVTPADVDKLDKLIASELPDGAVLCLAPGVYKATLWIERSITIRGSGRDAVIIDGGRSDPTIQVTRPNAEVTLESLTLRNGNGSAESGGNLNIFDSKTVSVRDVALLGGISDAGGGVLVRGGTATFEDCIMMENQGKLAQAIFVYQAAKARLRNCLIVDNRGEGPAATASWAGHIILENSTVLSKTTAALRAVGTGAQAPIIEVRESIIVGDPPLEIMRGGKPQPKVVFEHNAISSEPKGDGLTARNNIIGPVNLDAKHRPPAGSKAENFGAR
jgi:nitrous oxidase accessory protein NosD